MMLTPRVALAQVDAIGFSVAKPCIYGAVSPLFRVINPKGRNAMSAGHETSGIDACPVQGYEILRTLSEGGMGKIYLARQHALNRLVCVKVLLIPEGLDAELSRTRFCREAELLASASHPHILSVFDFGATGDRGLPYLVTEYIEGGDLRSRMKVGEAVSIPFARSILHQVGDALTYLHDKGILHRDLKPENILMPTESLAKVGDFGIAVLQDKAGVLTESFLGMGTVGYVAPEQQYGLKIDDRADQYSLASLSYELLTGRHPLGLFSPPSRLNSALSQEVDAVILRGLAEEPKNRFPSVREFATALDLALANSLNGARLSRRGALSLIAGLIVLAGLAWLFQSGGRRGVPVGEKQPPLAPNPLVAVPDPLQVPQKPAQPPAPSEQSADFKRLVELRAYVIWIRRGRPTGPAGDAVKEENWLEAERQITNEVKARAHVIWDQQGRPSGPAGDAVCEKNMRTAAAALLKETEEELRRHPVD
jgi:eukaryotic-like serine/threonine-protein kinase